MNHDTDLASALADFPEVGVAMIFGSAAAGRQTFESDIDVALAGPRPLSPARHIEIVRRLAQISGRAVDLVDLTTAPGPILSRALRTGRLLVCRDRDLYAELIRRLLYYDADFAPYRRRILAKRRNAWIAA